MGKKEKIAAVERVINEHSHQINGLAISLADHKKSHMDVTADIKSLMESTQNIYNIIHHQNQIIDKLRAKATEPITKPKRKYVRKQGVANVE